MRIYIQSVAAEPPSDLRFNCQARSFHVQYFPFPFQQGLPKGLLFHPMATGKIATALGEKAMLEVPPENASDVARGLDSSAQPSSQSSEHGDMALAEKGLGPANDKPPRDIHGIKWALAVISILISTFLFALDNTIVADVQPAIVERFGQVDKLPWLSVAFLVAAAGTNLVW